MNLRLVTAVALGSATWACASTPAPPSSEGVVAETKVGPGLESGKRALSVELQRDARKLVFEPLKYEPPSAQVETLPGGARLYLLEDHELPLVDIAVIVGVVVPISLLIWASFNSG